MLPAMAQQLQPSAPTPATAVAGELVDPGALGARAAEVAARQRSPETRRTYAAVYRAFGAFLGPEATPDDVIAEIVRAYRDALERAGRSPATVAKHLSALRGLAEALGVETQQLRTVRSDRVGRGEPRALTMTNGPCCCGCPTAAPARASGTSRCFTCSAPPACDAPKRPAC